MKDKLFLLLLCCYSCAATIKISNLQVPQSIELGSTDDIVLDCEFEQADDEIDVEVKWFFNGLINQIYQWIPDKDGPGQAMGEMKAVIDVDYKATDDKKTMYRALHITNVSAALTGNYSCKVSGFKSEDVATKSMTIYEPAESGLDLVLADFGTVVFCSADGIYPEPVMNLYITNENETEIMFDDEEVTVELDESGYNISATLEFDFDNLTSPFYYVCELEIPNTNYSLREKKSYIFEGESIETQIEEDLNNSTNSTDNLSEETQEFETQIEDEDDMDFNITTTISTTISSSLDESLSNEDDDDNDDDNNDSIESSSANHHLPVFAFYAMFLLAAIFKPIQLIR